jgi:hypothetical protein
MQRTKAFNALFEAEYAGIVAAGMMAKLVPVLLRSGMLRLLHRAQYSQYEACFGLLAL